MPHSHKKPWEAAGRLAGQEANGNLTPLLMDIFQHSKDEYFCELDRRNELRKALSLPMGLSVIFAGGLFSVLKGFEWASVPICFALLFGISSLLTALSLGVGIYFLVRSHVGYEYAYVPTAKEVRKYYDDLVQYYGAEGNNDRAGEDVIEYLSQEYSENAHHNALKNNSKSAFLHRANLCIVLTLIFLALTGALLLISDFMR